ncbi:hypothetical protein [Caballeronia sp. LZ033]|uniref:hypothetical protein n=1 Tax=Caballeronia sp. LZ033 TaxID=3038566 RepID=UPI00286A1F0A|nr:hypothetical protein [Caballeronia sp. LZ033]
MAAPAIASIHGARTIFQLNGLRIEAPPFRRNVAQAGERRAAVKLIERQSKATATIEWHDVTRGSYGDPVYAPNSRPVPSNAGAMILASVLDQAMPR